ncbi:MAG: T9SS type A sorting domain-containing protein [Ignavibacteriales bacterium]|nr:T9SS type A sorting domain-containing protein [Ignavibacteriales bacterium]
MKNLIGNFNFKLSNEGETLRIFDNNNFLIDSISYGIDLPWPTKPNGNGSTLELKDELLDNSDIENWQASFILGGTPGKVNSSDATSADKYNSQLTTKYFISQNYPNPFNPSTTIKYEIPSDLRFEAQDVRLEVFDVLGKEVATLVNQKQKSGFYKVTWDASSQTSGVYFYRLKVGEFIQTQKMILLR